MSAYKVNQEVLINNSIVKIVQVFKGGKTKKPVYQSGVLMNGFKCKPCTYLLSNGQRVKGSKLQKVL